MSSIEQLIDQIPIKHDLSSSIMLIGIVQSLFISLLIFVRSKKNYAIKYLGWSFFIGAFVFLDTYLCYTGLIKNVLFLNDATEPLVLLIFPFVYFSIFGLLKREAITFQQHWWHFILPAGYFLSQIPFYIAPLSVKYNAYLGAYFPDLKGISVDESFSYSYQAIKDILDWFILFSILLYAILSLNLVKIERSRNASKKTKSGKYIFSRNSVVVLLILLIFIFSIFYSFDDDAGDHYISFLQTLVAFSTSYLIMAESRFFEKSWVADKYETIGSATTDIGFEEIQTYVDQEEYFLSQEASLNNLASLLKSHPNQISKLINLENESNFNDYINHKRVNEAKIRLVNSEYSNLTIEAIGSSVGFKSKSAFYSAFKKHTNTSPSAFVKSVSP